MGESEMRTVHPSGSTDLFMVAGTRYMAELEANWPGWVTIGSIGSESALLIDHTEWDAFVSLVNEINEQVLERRK
jgi:hypothetical protein